MDELKFNLIFQDGFVRIELRENVTRLWADFNPAQIEELIAKLADMRKQLQPEVPRTLPDGQYPNAEIDPIWNVHLVPLASQKILFVRSVGMGWQCYSLSEAEAQKLGHALSVNQSSPSFPTQVRQ